MSKWVVLISAGYPIAYTRVEGWSETLYPTAAEAQKCAAQARQNDGWATKLMQLSDSDAAHWNETPGERLKRERLEHEARVRAPNERIASELQERRTPR